MKYRLAVISVVISTAATAQHSHVGMPPPSAGAQSNAERGVLDEQRLFFEGEVRAIDKASGSVTLKHGRIRVLDVPATTGTYPVRNASMLDQIKSGDRIRFAAVMQNRLLLVTQILPAN